jgi:glycosyltransferase involved in cell wall biosynthesis
MTHARELRIACALPEYSPHVSGSGVYAKAVCEALVGRGHAVTVVCAATHSESSASGVECIGGVRVWRGIGGRRGLRSRLSSAIGRLHANPGRALLKSRALDYEAALGSVAPDVVLALPVPRQSVVGAALYARRTGCPSLVVPFYHVAFERFVDDAPAWFALLGSFSAVLPATRVEQSFFESAGLCASRLRRPGMFVQPLPAPSSADVRCFRDRLGIGPRFLVVTAAAEFSEPKGSSALLRVAAALPHIAFAFVGGTPRTRAWLTQSAPPGSNVHMLGFLDEREKAIAFAAADLFALPSRADSFGIAYQEAHSLGTPSFALDLPVMREVIGEAGIFVDPHTGDHGVARALAELVRRPDQLSLAAKAATDVAAKYAPAPVLGAICDLVEEIAAKRAELSPS